jgi:hypothetical protein
MRMVLDSDFMRAVVQLQYNYNILEIKRFEIFDR